MPVPTQLSKLVPYLSAHAAIYKAAPASYGILPATATDLDNKAKALAAAYADAADARKLLAHRWTTASLSGSSPQSHGVTTESGCDATGSGIERESGVAPSRSR